MKKQNLPPAGKPECRRNPVAKFACRLHRGKVHADKQKYRRQAKHQGFEPYSPASA